MTNATMTETKAAKAARALWVSLDDAQKALLTSTLRDGGYEWFVWFSTITEAKGTERHLRALAGVQ